MAETARGLVYEAAADAVVVLLPPVARTGPLGFFIEVTATMEAIAIVLEAVAVAVLPTKVAAAAETLEAHSTIVANVDYQVGVLEAGGACGASICWGSESDCASDGSCDCEGLGVHFLRSFSFVLCRGWCGVVEERYEPSLYRSDFWKSGFVFRLLDPVFRLFHGAVGFDVYWPKAWFYAAGPVD